MPVNLETEVLVVGGGTGGTAAALQAARRGAKTILVSEFSWLGGMLTSAGVAAPDGNELLAWQTGIWGAYLRALQQHQPGGLDHGWVSFFTYDPRVGAQIFADWVAALPNLQWIAGQLPLEVLKQGDRITGVRFPDYRIQAQVTIDGTELGDLLALAEIPHRWGWELQAEFEEPSAPTVINELTRRYPVQVPTWVVVMQDFGAGETAPPISPPPTYDPDRFAGAWEKYGAEAFLNYGRLPGDRFMINWPIHGNDYGEGVQRLVESNEQRQQFLQEARWHSQGFAHFIQTQIDRRYGLAVDIFPENQSSLGGGAYALHPYYRESRRLKGLVTVREQDLLPIAGGCVAPLPISTAAEGCLQVESCCQSVAIGNYVNDHHYPSGDIALQPKSMRWGGRWTGTPFTLPYGCLIPIAIDGFLVSEKNISVTHMANGATRLQPLVLGIGQAAGMAAALCIEHQCQPRELSVRQLQAALLQDPIAPSSVIPLINLAPDAAAWQRWQQYYLEHPEAYPGNGECPLQSDAIKHQNTTPLEKQGGDSASHKTFSGTFLREDAQIYFLQLSQPLWMEGEKFSLVTLRPEVNDRLNHLESNCQLRICGKFNRSGNWILVEAVLE